MSKIKKPRAVTISDDHVKKAKRISKKVLGKGNVSGAIAYLIEKEKL